MKTKQLINSLTRNLNVKCEWCGSKIKKKSAFVKNVKRLEFVHRKKTFFCDEKCCDNYIDYELNAPRKISLCSSCPVPDLPEKD